jgi:hypothetical protein
MQGVPTYLEASSRRSAGGFYARLGYQPVGDLIKLPNGVDAYPMWRAAREIRSLVRLPAQEYGEDGSRRIRFGNYEWNVLEVREGKVLIISDKALDNRKFHETYKAVTWENADLRKYLNETFYNTFTDAEKARILETRISNLDNPWFGTSGGSDTMDKIFLLSVEEVVSYFGNSKQLQGKNPNTKYYISDYFNHARRCMTLDDQPTWWWLRTPGNEKVFAACVTDDGRIAVSGDFVNRGTEFNRGVRPALWLSF